MRRLALSLAALAWLAFGLVPTAGAASPWTTARLVNRSGLDPVALGDIDVTTAAASAGSADPAPTEESRDYTLLPRRVRWHAGPTVEYRIVGAPFRAAEDAVERSAATLDRFITTRAFRRDDGTRQLNPCTGQPNTVRWARLDGPGGVLAVTTLCQNLDSREIGGFEMVFDSADGWSIGPDGNLATYDVQNVATHEFGHVAGLDHVSGARDACLSMYFATGPEEIEQRTLGLGDKIGLDKLYDTGDTSPGPGCGR